MAANVRRSVAAKTETDQLVWLAPPVTRPASWTAASKEEKRRLHILSTTFLLLSGIRIATRLRLKVSLNYEREPVTDEGVPPFFFFIKRTSSVLKRQQQQQQNVKWRIQHRRRIKIRDKCRPIYYLRAKWWTRRAVVWTIRTCSSIRWSIRVWCPMSNREVDERDRTAWRLVPGLSR